MTTKIGGLLIGFALLAIGSALIYWGYSENQSFTGQIGNAFSGSPSNRVMMFYAGGAVCGVLGLFLAFKK